MRFALSSLLLSCLVLCGHSLRPCDSQNAAMAKTVPAEWMPPPPPVLRQTVEPSVAPRIAIKDRYDVGQLISARFEGQGVNGAKAAYQWSASEGVELEAVDGGQRVFIGAKSGAHTVTLQVSYTIQVFTPNPEAPTDPAKAILTTLPLPPYTYSESFTVGPETPPIPPPVVEPDPSVPPVVTPPAPTTPATAAVYIHEKDESPVPTPVTVGLSRLNLEKRIVATLFEDDTEDGDGDVPEQYKAPLTAARQAGLPSLVVMAGNKVLAVVAAPDTVEEVWSAVP